MNSMIPIPKSVNCAAKLVDIYYIHLQVLKSLQSQRCPINESPSTGTNTFGTH